MRRNKVSIKETVGSVVNAVDVDVEIVADENPVSGNAQEHGISADTENAEQTVSSTVGRKFFRTPQSEYEILNRLGAGGMGEVFKVQHQPSGRIMALKLLHGKFSDDKQLQKRFEQEAETASLLDHENLASVYEGGISLDGEPYLLMDYIEGETLAELIKRESGLNQSRFLKIFIQVCDGLIHAHAKRLLHRDLKPANIMRSGAESSNDFIKLVDFGIAKVLPSGSTDEQRVTQTGEVLGSPVYMSPEQCLGHALDERSDIYSLGCVMYEALTGRPPFLGDNVVQTIFSHLHDKPAPFPKSLKSISPELEAVVFQCLEKKPEDRIQSMSDLKTTLELLQHPDEKRKRQVLQTRRFQTNTFRWIKKHRSKIALSSVCLGVLLIAGAYNLAAWSDENRLQSFVNQAQIFEEQAKTTEYDSIERKESSKQVALEWHKAIDLAKKMKKSDRVIANLYMRLAAYETDPAEKTENLKTAINYYDHDGKCLPELLQAVETLSTLLDSNNGSYDLKMKLKALSPDQEEGFYNAEAAREYQRMVEISKSQLKLQPHSTFVLDRLEQAYYSLGVEGPQQDRIANLEMACFIGSPTSDYRHALDAELTSRGINPKSTAERIKLAKKAEGENAFDRAAVEYQAALRIENAPILEKMIEVSHSIAATQNVKNGQGYLNRTDFDVIPLMERQLTLTRQIFKGKVYSSALHHLAQRYIGAGRFAEAARCFEQLQEKSLFLDNEIDERERLTQLAEYGNLQFRRGLLKEARGIYKEVLSTPKIYKFQFDEAEAIFEYYFEVLEALNLKNELALEKTRLEHYRHQSDRFFRQGDSFSSGYGNPPPDVNLP